MQSYFVIDSPVPDVLSVCTSQPKEQTACCPCRFVVYNPDHSLRGYWWIRKADSYVMTVKDPISKNHFMKSADTPEMLLEHFYASYVKYLKQIFDYLDSQLKFLPKHETPKAGFRPGWLQRKREQLVNRRAILRLRSRDALAELATHTRLRNWPVVNLPTLPWEQLNASNAAAATWVRSHHGDQVPEQPLHPYDRSAVRSDSSIRT